MPKTVKDFITELLEQPLDAEIAVEVNGDVEYDNFDISNYGWGRRRVLIKIEIPEVEEK